MSNAKTKKDKQKMLSNFFSLKKDKNFFEDIKTYNINDKNNVAICLYVNKKYIEGLEILLYSLKKNNINIPSIVLLSEDILEKPKNVDYLININVDNYKYFEFPEVMPRNTLWPKSIFYKLSIFNIRGYDRIIFIDSDMLVIDDISELWDLNKYNEFDFYATCSNHHIVKFFSNTNHKALCTALMIINKNFLRQDIYKRLIELAILYDTYDGSDQGVINSYIIKNNIKYGILNDFYNIFAHISGVEEKKILHFFGGWKINKLKSWYDRIHQKCFKKEYIEIYDKYWDESTKNIIENF